MKSIELKRKLNREKAKKYYHQVLKHSPSYKKYNNRQSKLYNEYQKMQKIQSILEKNLGKKYSNDKKLKEVIYRYFKISRLNPPPTTTN